MRVMSLAGKTLFITGASRGIGLAIALRAARDGANIAIAAKTAEPHKHLPGTIYEAAAQIERAGGRALPLLVDVRDEASVNRAVEQTVQTFGGIDICVNNASAIQLSGTLETELKRYDLMNQVNARGTFLTSRACIPHLKRAENPHVLALSPPLDMNPRWFAGHVAYTMAKFGMSMCVLGMAEEFRGDGIAFNALWPRTAIATAAIEFALTGAEGMRMCRKPEIIADAAYAIFNKPARALTGQFLIDDTFLYGEGVRDFDVYSVDPTQTLLPDFFVPESAAPPPGVVIGSGSLLAAKKR
ncbi:MAG: short chain dehydrogenase family protein [Myxococcaceae bacterium]|nr:short chain dehydrogenase family protein [Myxococcaceae bacterium]